MAKKKKAKEKENWAEMSPAELEARLREIREEQFRLRFTHAQSPLKNPMQLRDNRRDIARIHTWLRAKKEVA
jgi:large subunit ribosomal protein L29